VKPNICSTLHIATGEQVTRTSTWQQLLENPGSNDHIAQTYQDESFLLEAVGHYVRAGLQRDEGVVLIMRKTLWVSLFSELEALGVNLSDALERGQLRTYDANETLAGLMKNGSVDHNAFRQMIGSVVGGMRRRYPVIRAFGEMVNLLWHEGRREAAIGLEKRWNALSRTEPFALLCAYRVDTLDRASYCGAFGAVCKSHTHLIPARDYRRFDDAVSRASREVLDQPTVMMLETMAAKHKPRAEMPTGQTVVHWLSLNMPRTADRILARARFLYTGAA
jgi:hypothetical protein